MQTTKSYMQQLQSKNHNKIRFFTVATCLSLVVILCVFWYLKLIGITMAGEAFCGKDEHLHTEACLSAEGGCEFEEHVHIESCYSDIKADLETEEVWEESLSALSGGGSTAEKMVQVAQSQLGVTESTLNFEVGQDGVRRGITRYGQWYGNPYGDWSAMFVAFCLNYAGASDLPTNAGCEAMRVDWEQQGLYHGADAYAPKVGDVVFITADQKTAQSVAVAVGVTDNQITVIAGDVDNAVSQVVYDLTDNALLGYGELPEYSTAVPLVDAQSQSVAVATKEKYASSMLTSSDSFVLYTVYNSKNYAIDGSGNAVEVTVDSSGKIFAAVDDTSALLWKFSRYDSSSTAIQNTASGLYLRPYYNSSSDSGLTTPTKGGTTVSASGEGAKFSKSAYITFDGTSFAMTRTQSQNITFMIGRSKTVSVWFDGTCGGIMSLGGSDDTRYGVPQGGTMTLPATWKSPAKYEYTLKGWYDISHHQYYQPGAQVEISENTVFYADWKAASYDVGVFNNQVAHTISTNDFVTTRMFDYGALMNLISENVTVTVSESSHSEVWNLLTSGNNPYTGDPVTNFIFRDWDRGSEDISYPKNHNDRNNPTSAGEVYQGLYTDGIRESLFNPQITMPGKEYLGEADHLFQYCDDPAKNDYGYFYYDSEHNAASFNKTDRRFYVYEYLEASRDSVNNSDNGKYSDFLPFNSQYANTNGKTSPTYSYEGVDGEYEGVTHYMYDSRYNDSNNSTNNVGINFWFGMNVEVDFYLPDTPGAKTPSGNYGNKDINGQDMHFRFTGDDDVWIFVDDTMVLDLGGLHGRETGDINFSTGVVTINGEKDNALSNALQTVMGGQEHVLNMYYLERGSSMSNCAVYFNLAPRFHLSIQKEDAVSSEVLNGAEFSVFTDRECTQPAQLWNSREEYKAGIAPTNTFRVVDGAANMWGLSAGSVEYFIKETKPPDNPDYGFANGIIYLTLEKQGSLDFHMEIIESENGVSPGFLVHGFRIDPETQHAYLIATNAPKWVSETTKIQVMKHWDDSLDHKGDSIRVYLTSTDAQGQVHRLQEVELSDATDWMHKWENLPKYDQEGNLVKYGVQEAYVEGYYSTVERADGSFEVVRTQWQDVDEFENGKIYLLKNASGQALSTTQVASDTGFMWVDAETAKDSSLALWTASVSGQTVRFTNQSGQTLTARYQSSRVREYLAYNRQQESSSYKQYLTPTFSTKGVTFKYGNYYLYSTLNSSKKFQTGTQSGQALVFTPSTKVAVNTDVPVEDQGFLIGNVPLETETSVTVTKKWSIPDDMDEKVYEREEITIRLYADGVDTGRTVILNLKDNWKAVFQGLPYKNNQGNVIVYSVKEAHIDSSKWSVTYGDLTATEGDTPQYAVTITNTYRTGGPILPSTGSSARQTVLLWGGGIITASLLYGVWFRRRQKRRLR